MAWGVTPKSRLVLLPVEAIPAVVDQLLAVLRVQVHLQEVLLLVDLATAQARRREVPQPPVVRQGLRALAAPLRALRPVEPLRALVVRLGAEGNLRNLSRSTVPRP